MVTSDAWPVVGQLMRWVSDDGEIGYEARIDGLEEAAGICEAVAFDVYSVGALACVANNLRYEWENIIDGDWQYKPWSCRPNERFPGTE